VPDTQSLYLGSILLSVTGLHDKDNKVMTVVIGEGEVPARCEGART
jgi:hypothetical protein